MTFDTHHCAGERQLAQARAALAQALMVASRRLRAELNNRLKDIGQSDARCAALSVIASYADGLGQGELSERLGVEGPTTVRLLDALEGLKWVERREHPVDRRAKRVRVTAEGAQALAQAREIICQVHEELLADASLEEIEACMRLLRRLG